MMRKNVFWSQLKRSTTLHSFLLFCASVGMSVALTTAFLQLVASSSNRFALVMGLVITLVLTGALFWVLRRIVNEFIACDATLRRLVLALIVSFALIVALFAPSYPRTLTWRWGAGPQAGNVAPVFSGTSWDEVARRVIELHATNNPEATPYGVWRAVADLSDTDEMLPVTLELWVTQPSWAVIDPATNAPPPNLDGVDVIVRVEEDGAVLSEQRIPLDPPVAPEQRSWRRVVVDLPADAERLSVEVAMRQTLDYDRVWMTEATVRPFWEARVGRVALILLTALAASTLVFLRRLPLAVQGAQRLTSFFADWGWLLVGVSCLWLAYMLVWQRGLYLDDYSLKDLAVDLVSGERRPIFDPSKNPNYPARILTWILLPQLAALVPDYTFFARAIMAFITGLNAFLLGWFVFELTASRLVGTVAGWLFLVHPYTDVPFWIGAGGHLIAISFTIFCLISLWRALSSSNNFYLWSLVGFVCFAISLAFGENGVSFFLFVPSMVFLLGRKFDRGLFIRLIVLLSYFIFVFLLYYLIVKSSALIVGRGGLDVSLEGILSRVSSYSSGLTWYVFRWGPVVLLEALNLGFEEIYKNFWAKILFVLSFVFVLVFALSVEDKFWHVENGKTSIFIVLVSGMAWFFGSLFIPYVAAHRQNFEIRFVYSMAPGFAIFCSAVLCMIMFLRRKPFLVACIVFLTGSFLLVLSLSTLGFSRAYAERTRLDDVQRETLARSIPSDELPYGAVIIPYQNDEQIFAQYPNLSLYLFSAMEAPWSAWHNLRMLYKRDDLQVIITNRWAPMLFKVEDNCGNRVLKIQNREVSVDRIVIYQYYDRKIKVAGKLAVEAPDGTSQVFSLPLGERLISNGLEGIPVLVVGGDIYEANSHCYNSGLQRGRGNSIFLSRVKKSAQRYINIV